MKIAIFQMNSIVGDFSANIKKIINAAKDAKKQGADILITPELSVTGYPAEDLLFRKTFLPKLLDNLELFHEVKDIIIIIGYIVYKDNNYYNCASIIKEGQIIKQYYKSCLPNNSVFDEFRYFTPGNDICVFHYKENNIGILICEDIWNDSPISKLSKEQIDLLIVINASPFYLGKLEERQELIKEKSNKFNIPIVYVNSVGGQDELVFDGASFVINKNKIILQADYFKEQLCYFDYSNKMNLVSLKDVSINIIKEQILYQAIVLALKDYLFKTGFNKVCLGLSGGIDSALVLIMAVDAIGANNCEVFMMPSIYTSKLSNDAAMKMVKNLNIKYSIIDINDIFNEYKLSLAERFSGLKEDVTEENLQARIRGTLLMALSNKTSALLLTTGNKSEIAMGYATLYGDMNGGYAPIKDLYKTQVYNIANWLNKYYEYDIIPQEIIDRKPSAELRENQTDQDSLPEYEVLDKMLSYIIEEDVSLDYLISQGFDKDEAMKTLKLIRLSEYKRKQSAIGPKLSKKSFGKDWRFPICHKFFDF